MLTGEIKLQNTDYIYTELMTVLVLGEGGRGLLGREIWGDSTVMFISSKVKNNLKPYNKMLLPSHVEWGVRRFVTLLMYYTLY